MYTPYSQRISTIRNIAPLVAAALIGAGSSIAQGAFSSGQGKRQKRLMDYQYKKEEQYQKNMAAHNWTNYNSPAAQRRSMEAAGINPFAGDSSIGGMQVSANSSGPDLQEAPNPGRDFAAAIGDGATSLFQMQEQKRVNDSIIYKNTSEGNKAQSDANKTNLMMPGSLTLQDLEVELKELGVDISEFDKFIKGVDAKYHEQLTLANLNQIRENINESITRQHLNYSQQKVHEKMLYHIDAEIRKMNAEIKTEGAKQLNLGADTRLKNAQKNTEEAREENLRALTRSEDEFRAAKKSLLLAEEDLKNAQGLGQIIKNDLDSWLADQITNRRPTEDWYTMALELVDRYLEYRGQNIQRDSADKKSKDQVNSVVLGLILRYMMAAV